MVLFSNSQNKKTDVVRITKPLSDRERGRLRGKQKERQTKKEKKESFLGRQEMLLQK
jgi:hypothetical protein